MAPKRAQKKAKASPAPAAGAPAGTIQSLEEPEAKHDKKHEILHCIFCQALHAVFFLKNLSCSGLSSESMSEYKALHNKLSYKARSGPPGEQALYKASPGEACRR